MMRFRAAWWLEGIVLFSATLSLNLYASSQIDLDQKLAEFESDSKAFMNDRRQVQKYDPETLEPIQVPVHFSEESINSNEFILQKDFAQRSGKVYLLEGRSQPWNNDLAEYLVDQLKFNTLQAIEEAKLRSSALPESPWSDDYWPVYRGVIARRYSDPNFPNSKDWATNINYLSRNSCSVNQLSPAEKYDLLIGDSTKTLTRVMLAQGQAYYKRTGRVEPWMGICHGWAPASFMLPRPVHAITLLAPDGRTQIPFYPSDIKALASLLWAKASSKTRFIGGRCNVLNPRSDQNGRVLTQECFDTNPGTWHLAIVNQIGVSRRSFVIDATYDYEVWNQPAFSYEYSYFNPQAFKAVPTLNEAIVPRDQFSKDKFRAYRAKNGRYVVGISMKFVYIAETKPTPANLDSPEKDKKVAVNYLYDLELDENFKIIGGEWYNRLHPDFLFVPAPNGEALSVGDNYLKHQEAAFRPGWDGKSPMPELWKRAALGASPYGQPLAAIVETLGVVSNIAF